LKIKKLTDLLTEELIMDGPIDYDNYSFDLSKQKQNDNRKKLKSYINNKTEKEYDKKEYDKTEDDEKYNFEEETDDLISSSFLNKKPNQSINSYPNFSVEFYKLLSTLLSTLFTPSLVNTIIKTTHEKTIENGMLYIDLGEDEDNNVSYLPNRYLEKLGTSDEKTKWDNKYRVKTKIGRFLSKIDYNDGSNNNIKTIEFYKLEFKKLKRLYHFEIVDGDEITKWYHVDNYEPGGGSLNNSCMRHNRQQYRFKFYANIPEIVKMLIMKHTKDSNKIIGRSLIWKTESGMYMDRIYTKNNADKRIFENYAQSKNWKYYDQYSEKTLFPTFKVILPKGERISVFTKYINFFKKTKISSPSKIDFPYMDTFKYYYYENEILSNKLLNLGMYIILNDL